MLRAYQRVVHDDKVTTSRAESVPELEAAIVVVDNVRCWIVSVPPLAIEWFPWLTIWEVIKSVPPRCHRTSEKPLTVTSCSAQFATVELDSARANPSSKQS